MRSSAELLGTGEAASEAREGKGSQGVVRVGHGGFKRVKGVSRLKGGVEGTDSRGK
jgi:hypothetical protein